MHVRVKVTENIDMAFALEVNVHKSIFSDCCCTMIAITDMYYTLKLLQRYLDWVKV